SVDRDEERARSEVGPESHVSTSSLSGSAPAGVASRKAPSVQRPQTHASATSVESGGSESGAENISGPVAPEGSKQGQGSTRPEPADQDHTISSARLAGTTEAPRPRHATPDQGTELIQQLAATAP